jgi:hypothetical protein
VTDEYNQWDIVLAGVVFEEKDEEKRRPVVIAEDNKYYILGFYTTKQRKGKSDEFSINYWAQAGLTYPTFIRLGKVLELDKSRIIHKLGRLHPKDIIRLEEVLNK